MVALLTVPPATGDTTPITRMKIEKNRPNLCLRSVTNAITAAPVWITIDENNAHRKTWYHISTNLVNVLVPTPRRPITLAIVSNSDIVSEYIAYAESDSPLGYLSLMFALNSTIPPKTTNLFSPFLNHESMC